MAWNTRSTYATTDPPVVLADTLQAISSDIRTWGGNVDGGAHALINVTDVKDGSGHSLLGGAGTFSVTNYGAAGNGTTDDSTAIQNAINAATTAGGGTVFFPAGTYKVLSQLTIANTGGVHPRQVPVRMVGVGATWSGIGLTEVVPNGGSILDLQYSGAGGAKILTLGAGLLEIAGMTLTDTATDAVPFVLTTNTTLHVIGCAFIGKTTKTGASCDEDAIVLGGPNITQAGTKDDPFQGYGTVIERCYFDHIRRAAYLRSWANGIVVRDNLIHTGCGGTAAIESAGNSTAGNGNCGGVIAGNVFEVVGYTYGIKFDYSTQFSVYGNSFYDASVGGVCAAYVYLTANTQGNSIATGFADESTVPYVTDLGTNTVLGTYRPTMGGYSIVTKGLPSFALAVPSGSSASASLRLQDASGHQVELLQGYNSGTDEVVVLYDRSHTATRFYTDAAGNVGLGGVTGVPAGAKKSLLLVAGSTAPSANPSSGFVLYVDPADNKLKARGASGTITTIANP